MDPFNTPKCSHGSDESQDPTLKDNDIQEPTTSTLGPASPATPNSFILTSSVTEAEQTQRLMDISLPLLTRLSIQSPILHQPRSELQSPKSLVVLNQPPTLFHQALTKLKESSMSIAGLSQLKNSVFIKNAIQNHEGTLESGDVTPPDSLANAPPSYSFVLRQMAARRRPRLMGTFIPSPSFIQHTPPPTYATAFDIYVDNPIPPPPPRVYNFGFASMPATCPECGFTGMTVISTKITLCTHMCAFLMCVFCCWLCAPLPYILRSCKDVYHYCRNCRMFLGMYCPTNPENNY